MGKQPIASGADEWYVLCPHRKPCAHPSVVPSSEKALEELIKAAKASGNINRDRAHAQNRSRAAQFIKTGLDLEREL